MSNLILFEEKRVRRVWDEESKRWAFAIVDVLEILTDSVDPHAYWRKLKERLKKEGNETVTSCHAFKMTAADGKQRLTDAADAEQLLRLIQSVPSPKAEPFKRWLAKVGYERLQEIENPELASQRTREIYRQKGYSDAWIEKRMRGIAVRDELTDEWKKRGVKEQLEYAILTAEISKATFGMTPTEYRDHKALTQPGDNLRDHMTDLELIFTMLGEASTTEIARNTDARGFPRTTQPNPKSRRILYQTEHRRTCLQCRFANEMPLISDLFRTGGDIFPLGASFH
ncbi:MAG: Bro-N domain-containing protein [Myxococcota bacterium]|jgi:hypothetical protein|nr:Bro-N domain-containing protein [Myxococcota bacterium]